MTERLENMKIITTEDYNELSEKAAKIIANKLILNPKTKNHSRHATHEELFKNDRGQGACSHGERGVHLVRRSEA